MRLGEALDLNPGLLTFLLKEEVKSSLLLRALPLSLSSELTSQELLAAAARMDVRLGVQGEGVVSY